MASYVVSDNLLKLPDLKTESKNTSPQKKIGSALEAIDVCSKAEIDKKNCQEPPAKRRRIDVVEDSPHGDLGTNSADVAIGAASGVEDSDKGKLDFEPYVMCNEQNQAETLNTLKNALGKASPGAHIGFSGWFNYDIIAATKSERAVICDINVRMIEFYGIFESVLVSSANRAEFVQEFTEALGQKGTYFDNGYLWMLPGELNRPGSWLSTDEGFERIKTMHQDNRVEYRFLNAAASLDKFEEIKQKFERKGIPIRTVYASNIFEWLEKGTEETKAAFKSNMRTLTLRETYYIDAYYPFLNKHRNVVASGTGPPLRVTKGELPLFTRTVLNPSRAMQLKRASLFQID